MLLTKLIRRLDNFFTPIKSLSVLLILLSISNHLYNPFEHACTSTESISLNGETFARIIFMFCGMFGLFGNGRTRKIRAIVIGFPFIYLGTLFILSFVNTRIPALITPMITYSCLGLWTFIRGAKYERRT